MPMSALCFVLDEVSFSTSAKELSYLLVGKTSQGRGSKERERGSDPLSISKYC